MSLELRHVRYFIAVAEELNFGRAAARLHMAQPPLSAQIQALEKELGVRLFDRTGRGTTLTREGEVFLLEARQITDQVSRARRAVNQTAAGDLGRLRVAGVPYAFLEELPMVVPRFRRENPNIVLDLRESGTQESIDSLLAGTLDIAFVRAGDPVEGLEILPMRTGRFEAIVPVGHRLVGVGPIDIADLAFEPFVVTSRDISPYYYDQSLSALANAGVTPRTVIEATSIQAQIGYVACGMGVSLVPTSGMSRRSKYVEWIALSQPIISTEVAVAWAVGPIPRVMERFLDIVREEVEVEVDHGAPVVPLVQDPPKRRVVTAT
ncbi:LysR family transcriptional regulator [Lacisediminihabitans profunda]|uniref:LysR family transcriptional regulator n=1 Tax=Lacisediminihabitans profunda TaxID=2594790 RepID=A0A5C8UQ23_9MICO|nr:LysR substrate-binding domain-containing protein [Lacisediminihabitans profunda]TXN30566.1 LysR family transcriptional regulator [Lacisediminihabitans profunda]